MSSLRGELTHIFCARAAAPPLYKLRGGPHRHRETPSLLDTPDYSPLQAPEGCWSGSRSGIQLHTPDLQTGTHLIHTEGHTHTQTQGHTHTRRDKHTVNVPAEGVQYPETITLRLSSPTGQKLTFQTFPWTQTCSFEPTVNSVCWVFVAPLLLLSTHCYAHSDELQSPLICTLHIKAVVTHPSSLSPLLWTDTDLIKIDLFIYVLWSFLINCLDFLLVLIAVIGSLR